MRWQSSAQSCKSSHLVQSDESEDHRSSDEDHGLHQIGVDYRRQSSRHGVNTGCDYQNDRRSQRTPPHHSLQHDGRRIKMDRYLREYVRQDGNHGQVDRARTAKAPLQEFRHGKHIRAEIEGNKHPAQEQQDQTCQPFEVPHCKPRGGPRTR